MSIQVISRDYNGTTSIIGTVDSMEAAVAQIKKEVSEMNFNNALTTENKFSSIEAYFPQFLTKHGEVSSNIVYAGNSTDGNHLVYDKDKLRPVSGDELRFYVGCNEGQDFFLENWQKTPITDFKNEMLEDKTFFFVKVLR